jgi:hypothetical protein
LFDRVTINHGGVDRPRPHGVHHRCTFIAVPQQYGKKMIVVYRAWSFLRKNDVVCSGELREESQAVGSL